MKESAFDLAKKIIMCISFSILIIVFVALLVLTMDDKFVRGIKDYIETDTKVLYISNKRNYNEYPIKILEKYEINYKYIESDKLSSFEKSKIRDIINNRDLSNIIVIFESGKIKNALLHYENEAELNKFLIENDIIPSIIGKTSGIKNKISNALNSDSLILYLPYHYTDEVEYQNELLKNLSKQFNVEYQKIDIYLLSKTQQQKINSLLEISDVEDQIVLFIKNKKVLGSLRGYKRKSEYINKLFEYEYAEEVYNSLTEIEYEEFDSKLGDSNKNVFLITKDDCKYCKETMSILNQVSSSNNLDIDYINIEEIDSDIALKVEERLEKTGYKDGFSTPLLLITEKNKIIDYSIGVSSIDFYQEMFSENGLIK